MASIEHSDIAAGEIHIVANWVVANSAARLALTVSASDVGKVAWQQDADSFWVLKDDSPMTWAQIGAGAGGGTPAAHNTSHENGGSDEIDVTGLSGVLADPQTPANHTHTSAEITDFAEAVEDKIGAKVVAGTGISVSYNDTTGETTVTNTSPDTGSPLATEDVQDIVGAMLADGDVDFNYDDPGATETNIVRKASENFALPGDISPAQLTANTDDWNPTGLSTASTIRFSTDASRNITGLQGGVRGRFMILHNIGSQNAVLKDESASSSAANRFALNADVTLGADQSALLQYDLTSSRWRLVAGPASASSGFSNPMTTLGDIITGASAGAAQRLAVGTENQVLKVVSGVPAWAADNGGTLNDPIGTVLQVQVNADGAFQVIGIPSAGTSGTGSQGSDTTGPLRTLTSTTGLNSDAGVFPSGGSFTAQTKAQWSPVFYARIKTGATITELRSWVGLLPTFNNIVASDTPTEHYAAFRFSTTASDTNWQCVTDNASGTPQVTDSGVLHSASSWYSLKIDLSNPASIKFYINNSLVATHATKVPTGSTNLGFCASARNTGSTNAKAISVNRMVISMP